MDSYIKSGMCFVGLFLLFIFSPVTVSAIENLADMRASVIPLRENRIIPSDSKTEYISSFHSTVTVNNDSSIDVKEIIMYRTGIDARHGIYRDIRTISSTGEKIKISSIAVVDENGSPYNFIFSKANDLLHIKIGDANTTFLGSKTYFLSYHVSNAVSQLTDVDEIYWNVTGNNWSMPIYEASAKVVLPNGTTQTSASCYVGALGSKEKCEVLENTGVSDVVFFNSSRMMRQGEGFTVAASFPKGLVLPYQESFSEKYGSIIGSFVFVLAVFYFMFMYWFKNWRDPKGTGVIVTQYDVPDGLTPMEVSGIVNESISTANLSAEIVYLATKGYLKIRQIEETTLGLFKKTDYEIICLKYNTEDLSDFDKKLMNSIFVTMDTAIDGYLLSTKLSFLKNTFYKKIPSITRLALDGLVSKQYYKNLGRIGSFGVIPQLLSFSSMAGIVAVIISEAGTEFSSFFSQFNMLPILMALVLSFLIFIVFWYLSPAKTEKGVMTKEYLLGLKEYLQIAEKDRLAFHNAPEKKPEVFEKLLPFAMVLGVEKLWAKEFEDIYTTPPSWYEGASAAHFSAVAFNQSLASFSSAAATSLSSSPSSSGGGGSFGGGSSGGGGGGGGGGSW